MNYSSWPNLCALFFARAKELGDRNFLWAKQAGAAYQPLTWRQTESAVKDLARGLRAAGVEPGQRVVLVSENRPEWLIADLAIMAAGAITVPAYTTNSVADHRHILADSGAVGAIVSTPALAKKLLPAALDVEDCAWVIAIESAENGEDGAPQKDVPQDDASQDDTPGVEVKSWQAVLDAGRASPDDIDAGVARITREDTACFIYTSGTGGVPKGVMLSHGAIICNCMGAHHLLESYGLGDEIFLCFLPLSHAYEHTAGQFFPMSIGAQIYYAEGVEHLPGNLAEARPTIMTAVPRLYETMHQRIRLGVKKKGGLSEKLFNKALDLGQKRYHAPASLGPFEALQDRLVDSLVRNKVRQRFGGRLKCMVSGGAALNPEIGIFFTALGVRLLQGYGQTEAAPVISANPPQRVKMETVGPPLEGVEVRIAEDGEILVRGELVMKGYWGNAEATAEALRDGWLHTGDIGEFDVDGYLKITDRKKDIIVLSGGDNVSPARVESILTLQSEIAQAMVYGDKRPHMVAVLVPDDDLLRHHGSDAAALQKAVGAAVDRANESLSTQEKVRRFVLADAPFTVDNGMATPTLKVRRHVVREHYGAALLALYPKSK